MKYALLVLSILFFTIVNFSYSQDLPCKEQYYNKRCKERYVEDANGRVHGKRISYLEDGQVEKIAYYNHGTLNGTVTEFYNWGKIITTYLNRVENGLYQKLENNGKILEKGNYTNGVQTGYWITNQGNNKGNYVNGVQTGYWIENQYDKGNFVNGEKQGAWELYMEGWEGDGGIIKGNYNNGKFNGTWSNVVVIRINNPYRRGDQIYYMQGYKAVFENGVYIQGFDEKGVDLITVEKRKQADADSIKRDDEEKAIIANPSLLFYSDSYYPIDSDNLRQFLSAFSNNINSHSGNDSVKIGIVGNTKNLSDISEQAAKGFYILSLNRAIAIQKILSPMITNKKVSYKYLGLGIQDSGYDEAKGNVKIFINQDIPDQYSTIYYELKSRFGV
ncbi:MAG TPA: hypothetical protein VNW06_00175, partial [Cytophagaceae bacterium]|nr:hypothetical protein [Cytophagaceae bacterium]